MIEIVLVVVCVAIAGVAIYLWNQKTKAEVALATAEAARKSSEELMKAKDEHYQQVLAQGEAQFKTLAQQILEERSAKLKAEGEQGIKDIAANLNKAIGDFRTRVEDINKEAGQRKVAMEVKINELMNQTNSVSEQANNLATAIRGKVQKMGEWGEFQLKRVLEMGGLQETIDYSYQETFASAGSDHKDLRTDVLVKMTDGRWMVIDAKTTMAAYLDYVQSDSKDKDALRRIVDSLKTHVEEMKTAAYHKNLEQVSGKKLLKTMLMYIPFEEVYLEAMKAEIVINGEKRLLRDYAFDNDIVFINSTGLLPIVRMLADFWSAAKADRQAAKIKQAAEDLVDKMRVFLTDKDNGFLELGNRLSGAVKCYNEAVKRLSTGPGNVMKRLSDMKEMGVPVASLPAAETVESRQIEA